MLVDLRQRRVLASFLVSDIDRPVPVSERLNNLRRDMWADTGYFDTLLVNDTIIWDFDRDFVPGKLVQTDANSFYRVVYSARIKGDTVGELVNPNNNVDLNGFQVRDLSFRKVPFGGGQGVGPSARGFDA